MNKSTKFYSITLSIVLLFSVFFQIQLLNTISYDQYYAYAQKKEIEKYEGEHVEIKSNTVAPSGKAVTVTWIQKAGLPAVDMNLTDSNRTLKFTTPEVDSPGTIMVFESTASSGKSNYTSVAVVMVRDNKAPIAIAEPNINMTTKELCNPQNTNNSSVAQVIFNGSQSWDEDKDSLKYLWTQNPGEITLNLTTPNESTTSFHIDDLCNISSTKDFIMQLMVTDNFNKSSTDLLRMTITSDNPELPDIIFET